jgi:hypothetical protein
MRRLNQPDDPVDRCSRDIHHVPGRRGVDLDHPLGLGILRGRGLRNRSRLRAETGHGEEERDGEEGRSA